MREFSKESVARIVNSSSKNTLHDIDEKSWKSPIVGFASGNDPLFKSYKTLIGEFYWTPLEAMKLAYPNRDFDEENLSVICWVLPQTDETLADQRLEKELPAKRWILSRHYGEHFNEFLRASMRDEFINMGIDAVAPAILEDFAYQRSDQAGICSNWSERHTAYAAGMGTFGLSDGFITEKGKALRIGSIVINHKITPDVRPYKTHTENCLFHAKGTCGVCMKRCPADAITKDGHNKQICHDYIRGVTSPYAKEVSGQVVTPCGLCQVKVPCEKSNPMSKA
ncbi:MAG: 4Fe-4S ferredoxin [Denitrovibrio sp.]|nr:MAG: 4Fe-4S ferredoxin [Denitrovibrio sp.]